MNNIYYAVLDPTVASKPKWVGWDSHSFDHTDAARVLGVENMIVDSEDDPFGQEEYGQICNYKKGSMTIFYAVGSALLNSRWETVFSEKFYNLLVGNVVLMTKSNCEPSDDWFIETKQRNEKHWAIRERN